MNYRDPKTKVLYPSKEWMFEHWATLPEVKKAYPDYKTEKELPVGSLAGTLPSEKTLPLDAPEAPTTRQLPTGLDQLTLLKLALKNISTTALRERKETATMGMIGTAGVGMGKFEEMGFDPSRMPGGFAGRIITTARQKAVSQLARERGEITEQYKTMEDMLTGIQNTQKEQQALAFQELGLMMNAGTLPSLTDEALENLSLRTKIPLEQITALRDAQKTDEEVVKAYAKAIEAGEMELQSIPDEKTRNEVAKIIDWTKIPEKEEFTSQQKLKLEQAGLKDASRQEKLDYLFGKGGEPTGWTFTNDDGTETELKTPEEAVDFLIEQDYSYEDIKYFLIKPEDEGGAGWSISRANTYLEGKELISTEEKGKREEETKLLDRKIKEYMDDWKESGNKGAGTREEFASDMAEGTKYLTYDEIMKIIYEQISDAWLEENKTWWGKKPGLG